jgi:hypothetical protein
MRHPNNLKTYCNVSEREDDVLCIQQVHNCQFDVFKFHIMNLTGNDRSVDSMRIQEEGIDFPQRHGILPSEPKCKHSMKLLHISG